jgi:hypothetical protein
MVAGDGERMDLIVVGIEQALASRCDQDAVQVARGASKAFLSRQPNSGNGHCHTALIPVDPRGASVTSARAEQYWRLARQCLAMARTVSTEEARAELILMAQTWFRLAEE